MPTTRPPLIRWRSCAPRRLQQDADGEPLWEPVAVDPSPADQPDQPAAPGTPSRPDPQGHSRLEVERRIAEAQLWIAQRLPLVEIRAKAGESWGVSNIKTVNRYLNLARSGWWRS